MDKANLNLGNKLLLPLIIDRSDMTDEEIEQLSAERLQLSQKLGIPCPPIIIDDLMED